LCGEEFCPLHRAIVTDTASSCRLIVFGLTKEGGRVPMTVSVAPIHDENGQVIGGVETFHDFSETYANLERARRIQMHSLEHDMPTDPRVSFASHYVPHDMLGGDYFAIRPLDADHYAFMIADVMGHGVAAALYTMHVSSLWSRHWHTLAQPAAFANLVNRELCRVVKDESFATAICGVLDAAERSVRIVSAGGPPIVVVDAAGGTHQIACSGVPFGAIAEADYDETAFSCNAGDSLLLFTDGVIEVCDAAGNMLGAAGLVELLRTLGYPSAPIDISALQKALLIYSNSIRLADDLTLLELRFS
ncbi:MAG: putative sensor protein, partial [Proteobacteria bacterium]|nr:putative sensor protein [Pseudomonadota bacterium]